MSNDSHSPDATQWGRPTKRKNKGVKSPSASASPAEASVVGPIDGPIDPSAVATIVRAAPLASSTNPYAPRREPDEKDEKLRDLVDYIARGLVDRPEDVSVNFMSLTGAETSLELRVHPDDIGHVIGKMGRTANAVRLMLGAAAAKAERRANLEIAD